LFFTAGVWQDSVMVGLVIGFKIRRLWLSEFRF